MHVAGGAQVLLQQPRFEIEAPGVDVAMRTLEPHRQFPALAGMQQRNLLQWWFVAAVPRFHPCESDAGRNRGALGEHHFDGKDETQALRGHHGQRVDDPDDTQVFAFPCGRQRVGEAQFRAPRRVAETRGERADAGDDRSDEPAHAPAPVRHLRGDGDTERAGQHECRPRRQLGARLQRDDTAGEGKESDDDGAGHRTRRDEAEGPTLARESTAARYAIRSSDAISWARESFACTGTTQSSCRRPCAKRSRPTVGSCCPGAPVAPPPRSRLRGWC